MVEVKIKKIDGNAKVPSYAHEGDAGMDIYSNEDLMLKAGERSLISTGIAMEIPKGYVGLVWDKSGLATKYGIKTKAGVVDSGYRGEVKIALINLGKEDFRIEKGMKIAQMLIQEVHSPKIIEVDELDDSSRGHGGFGSTGKY